MSMYLPNDDVRPTGAEADEFIEERPEAEPDDDERDDATDAREPSRDDD